MWQQRQTTRQRNDINKHLFVLFPLLGGGSNLNKLSIRPFDSDTIHPSAHVRSYWRNCITEVCSDLVVASLACHFPREVFYINKYIAEGHLELFICCNHTGKGATRLFNDSKYTDSMDIFIIYFKTYCYCNYYLSFFIKTSFWTKSIGLEKKAPSHSWPFQSRNDTSNILPDRGSRIYDFTSLLYDRWRIWVFTLHLHHAASRLASRQILEVL